MPEAVAFHRKYFVQKYNQTLFAERLVSISSWVPFWIVADSVLAFGFDAIGERDCVDEFAPKIALRMRLIIFH